MGKSHRRFYAYVFRDSCHVAEVICFRFSGKLGLSIRSSGTSADDRRLDVAVQAVHSTQFAARSSRSSQHAVHADHTHTDSNEGLADYSSVLFSRVTADFVLVYFVTAVTQQELFALGLAGI